MPITRTAMIDDDGTGTTGTILNNAWKQEFYNQIDAMVASGTWTPIDASGAGLAFTPYTEARYWTFDKLVVIHAHFLYPANSNGLQARFRGLPFPCGPAFGGAYGLQTATHVYRINAGDTLVEVANATTGAVRVNSELSGQYQLLMGLYLKA